MIFESRAPHVPASLKPTSFVAAPTRFGQWSVFKSKCKCGQFTSYAFSAFPTFLYPGLLQTCPRQPDPRRQLSEVLKTCKSTLVSCSQKSLKKKKTQKRQRHWCSRGTVSLLLLWPTLTSRRHGQLFWDAIVYNLPVSSLHGMSQARILEWVAVSLSRGSSWPSDWTCISCLGSFGFFTAEPAGKPFMSKKLVPKSCSRPFILCSSLRAEPQSWAPSFLGRVHNSAHRLPAWIQMFREPTKFFCLLCGPLPRKAWCAMPGRKCCLLYQRIFIQAALPKSMPHGPNDFLTPHQASGPFSENSLLPKMNHHPLQRQTMCNC